MFLSAVSRDGDGDAYKYNGKGKKKRLEAKINSDSDLALVRNGMHDVIYTASTSLAAHFGTLTPQVYGKSGTGEKSGEDEYAWFCAYAPADDQVCHRYCPGAGRRWLRYRDACRARRARRDL